MTVEQFSEVYAVLAKQLKGDHDTASIKAYYKILSKIDAEFVLMAADQLATSAEYFPKTSEWVSAAKAIERERIEKQRAVIRDRQRFGVPPLCVECDDTGWKQLNGAVARCECAVARRQEVLGKKPLPTVERPKALQA